MKKIILFFLILSFSCSTNNKIDFDNEIEKWKKEIFEIDKIEKPALGNISFENWKNRLDIKYGLIIVENDFNNDNLKDALFYTKSSNCMGKGTSDNANLIYSNNGKYIIIEGLSNLLEKKINQKYTQINKVKIRSLNVKYSNFLDSIILGEYFLYLKNKDSILFDKGIFKYDILNKKWN